MPLRPPRNPCRGAIHYTIVILLFVALFSANTPLAQSYAAGQWAQILVFLLVLGASERLFYLAATTDPSYVTAPLTTVGVAAAAAALPLSDDGAIAKLPVNSHAIVSSSSAEEAVATTTASTTTTTTTAFTSGAATTSSASSPASPPSLPSSMHSLSSSPSSMHSSSSSSSTPESFSPVCRVCRCYTPMRAKHCLSCRRCVRLFDHHCPYVGNCVGEGNRRYFVLFLVAHAALGWFAANNLWTAFAATGNDLYGGGSGGVGPAAAAAADAALGINDNVVVSGGGGGGSVAAGGGWSIGVQQQQQRLDISMALLASATLLAGVGGVMFTIMSCMHIFLVSTGQTTYEFVRRDRIPHLKELDAGLRPFDQGLVQNWRRLLFAPHGSAAARNWSQVYTPSW